MRKVAPYMCSLLVAMVNLLPSGGMAMDSIGSVCGGTAYTGSGKASVNTVLADLVAKGSSTGGGFATSHAGKPGSQDDEVYGLAQCRGDVSGSDCSACLADAARQLPNLCGNGSDARIWYDYCFVRYLDTNFIGQADTGSGVVYVNVQAAADNPRAFAKSVGKALRKATAQASGSGGLGRAKELHTPFVVVYGLAQCTGDLAPLACAQCLSETLSRFGSYCGGGAQLGCQINYSSCRLRYEIYPFYFPLDDSDRAGFRGATDTANYTKIIVHD